ncbi:MAG TPA: hypothetical protein P5322_12155, partial [Spirochaetota bacterium]|nr:hypothetical protein [Spirochaetota bacterium]
KYPDINNPKYSKNMNDLENGDREILFKTFSKINNKYFIPKDEMINNFLDSLFNIWYDNFCSDFIKLYDEWKKDNSNFSNLKTFIYKNSFVSIDENVLKVYFDCLFIGKINRKEANFLGEEIILNFADFFRNETGQKILDFIIKRNLNFKDFYINLGQF